MHFMCQPDNVSLDIVTFLQNILHVSVNPVLYIFPLKSQTRILDAYS